MALHELRLSSIVYDDVRNEMTLRLTGDAPERPSFVREDLWFPAPASFTVVIPIKRNSIAQPSGIYIDPATQDRFKITHNGTAWSAPVPVDEQGNVIR